MKIIIVNDYASVQGGAAQVAVISARGLADAGYRVTFVYGTGQTDPILNHSNIELISLEQYDLLSNPSKLNAMKVGIWNRTVEIKIDKILDQYDKKNTIVHLHSWVKSLSASAVSSIQKQNFPMVVTLHDYFTVCPNGGFYNYQKQSICHFNPMSINCLLSNCDARSYPQKLWRFSRQMFYTKAGIPNGIKHFISVSKFSENILNKHLPSSSIFWDVPNPIDIKKFKCSTPKDHQTFSYIGRLSLEKGVSLFANAAKKLTIKTRFVGDGDLKVSLQQQNNNDEFTGWANREKVVEYIKESRAIVFPSQLYETQGLIVAEASALGVPSIVADTSAASDFIIDGETGLLFKSGDVNDLIEKIKLLNENPKYAQKLGENAYDHYWESPKNMTNHIDKLVNCYKSILTQG